ncbi:SLC45 family MFS transporter [Massilia sp. Dwa41.01b]|uniref:MFS transporter n=1 Tax=unclassified Massilia TaxID=2609279 RepID=UPI0016001EA7|nr:MULTISPECIES: MFS transporter [unclassified Massilia]QNA90244.1 SLC45 family MFS transporter [Massilia sp. Dwa41.01b]QNB01137.1 SLC45 family MFS transporter [Massilia sp. Se16.2.3]
MLDFQRRLSPSFYALASLPATAMGFALCIQISALSWLLSTRYHLDIHEIGIVWAAGPLAGILGQVIIGFISDKTWFWGGRRRPFILVGGTLAALSVFLLPRIEVVASLLGTANLLVVAVIIALTLDLSINISFNPTRSLIADVTPEGEARTRGYTWMQTISGFWGVMAYLIGAYIDNYALISVGVFIVLAFSVLPVFLIEEPRELAPAQQASAEEATSTDWGQLWRLWTAHAFSWFGVQAMFVYIIAFIQQHVVASGATPSEAAAQSGHVIAISFAVMNVVGFLLPALVLAPLVTRFGRVRTQAGCVGIMALAYFAIALFARTPGALYALMAVVGIGWAAVVSLPFAIMSEKVDKRRMGFFMGLFNLSVVLPQLATTSVGYLLKSAADKNVLFLICGGCLAVSSVLWLLVRENKAAPVAAPALASAH